MNKTAPQSSPHFFSDAFLPMLRQEWRRMRSSAGNVMTTSVATAVIIALFTYIFGDFFKDKLPQINQDLASKSLFHLATIILVTSSLIISQHVAAKVRDPENWLALLGRWGVNNHLIKTYRWLVAVIGNSALLLICAFLIDYFLSPLFVSQWALVALLTIVAVFRYDFSTEAAVQSKERASRSSLDSNAPPLIAWRQSRIHQPAWPGSILRFLAGIPVLLGAVSVFLGQVKEISYLASLSGGILLSWTVPLLIDDDLKTAWIERQAAVSHFDWIAAWQKIFFRWAVIVFAASALVYGLAFITGKSMSFGTDLYSAFMMIIINGFLAAFPVWLAPSFVMQIDGKRPVTNMIMLTLIGIFVGSAVIAVPVAAPFVYLLHREAHRYQGGRFARGAYH